MNATLRMLRAAVVAELTKTKRVPQFIVPTIVFPILFFSMFGLPNAGRVVGGVNLGAYMLASYGAYAMMSTALISFGVSISQERALGWNRLLRVTPISPVVYFAAKAINALTIGAVSLVTLFAFGIVTAHVSLPFLTWIALGIVLLVGMLPFVLLGLALGYFASATAAAPIANLVFLPLSFASGLFIPLQMLPTAVRTVAPFLPSYHVGQLGWNVLGSGDQLGLRPHLLWLAVYGAAFGMLALVAYRRDEGRQFG